PLSSSSFLSTSPPSTHPLPLPHALPIYLASQPACAILLPPRPECTDRGESVVLSWRRMSIVGVPLDITARVNMETLQVSSRAEEDRKSTRLNSSHRTISYAVFCLKKKNK